MIARSWFSWVVLIGMGGLTTGQAQGPVAWYTFDTQGQPGLDSVGGNNGVATNTAQVAGVRGLAASFTNGYIQLPSSAVFNLKAGDFTLSVFVKSTDTTNHNWFTKASASAHLYGLSSSNTVGFSFDGGPGGGARSTTNVFDGQWHHVAGVKRNNAAEIWVDGYLENTGVLSLNANDDGQFAIGRDGACCEFFNGQMDEAKIWNRALSSTEIANEAKISRTLLVTFLGGNNAPDGSNCPLSHGTEVTYGDSTVDLLAPSRGMTNLLVNAKALMPSLLSKAFTFYSAGGDSCTPPVSDAAHHVEAENWVLQNVQANDRLVIAGHSYGGNRALLFMQQMDLLLFNKYGRHMIDGLALVDPIDWNSCFYWLNGTHCDQRNDPPKLITSGILLSDRVLVFRQQVDTFLRGYPVVTAGQPIPSANILDVALDHQTIDDSEPVQRGIINLLLAPQRLTAPGVTLQLTLQSVTRIPFGNYTAHLLIQNAGSLIADDITITSATLGPVRGILPVTVGGPLLPGAIVSVDVTFPSPVQGLGSSATLSIGGTYNNFAFAGKTRPITLP